MYHRNQTQHFASKSGGRSHWLAFEGSKKNAKNPLTNRPSCDTIKAQREDETLTETFRSADERTICYGKGTLQKTPCQFRKNGTPMRLKPIR